MFSKKARDPFSAVEKIKRFIFDNVSIYRMFDHNYAFDINTIRFGVYNDNHEFLRISNAVSPVHKAQTPTRTEISRKTEGVVKALEFSIKRRNYPEFNALYNAIRSHALSLDSNNGQNQLLDLWSIFEMVLDISNGHTSDRIVQVCDKLVPILRRKYIYSLFAQLAGDINNYSEEKYKMIIDDLTDRNEIIQRLCEFVLLDEYESQRNRFLDSCQDFPLLKERIEYYNAKLSKPIDVYNFVEKHSTRVRWQVMRIYRNRNMIIHNGNSMAYLDLLIENLHSYVDDFLDYIIQSKVDGFTQETMIHELYVKECKWQAKFQSRSALLSKDLISEMLSI